MLNTNSYQVINRKLTVVNQQKHEELSGVKTLLLQNIIRLCRGKNCSIRKVDNVHLFWHNEQCSVLKSSDDLVGAYRLLQAM